ncbi:MAG: hypothetical protein DMF87_18125 [Acidobacteria bacterium]|nr:MAG: hypothetical protein DMF88_20250 [Acidobacteriota bacterium]PYR76513.1 MAG: hypothetical protein DMF87_18125 [Acidobacteriota bacterium]
MVKIQSHRDLRVWQKGMDLVVAVDAVSRQFPVEERYGLIQQATSVMIVERLGLADQKSIADVLERITELSRNREPRTSNNL